MDKLERALDDVRRKWVPDARLGVFEIVLSAAGLMGVTSSREARDALRRLARDAALTDSVRLLPESTAGDDAAIVVSALAPLCGEPKISAPQVSEALHGESLAILERQAGGEWLRVRAPDDYIAWIPAGYVATGPADWATDWETRATARSLGAEIQTPHGRRLLPTGAHVALRRNGGIELADGARGTLVGPGGRGSGASVRKEGELRAEARHLALPELALKWYGGAPYSWGGRSDWGIDCSGLVQAVYAARGIALPRDSDQQFGQGQEVPMSADGADYEAGDVLCFADGGRVSHVALWAGAGHIVHAALSRGGVGSDHLFGPEPRMKRLAANLVGVRRPR